LIGPLQKKIEAMESTQNRRFYGKMECLPFRPSYIGEKGRTLGKHMGLKQRAIGNMLKEHIGNPLGNWWEHVGNKEKINQGTLSACLHIGCMKFLFPKLFVTIFGLS
jgi:hypothetical protein